MAKVTKKEIREYNQRVRAASSAIEKWLKYDRETQAPAELENWAEELTGCAGEVAKLIDWRYNDDGGEA